MGIDSKLYQNLSRFIEVVVICGICWFLSIFIFMLPLAVLCYCFLMSNIMEDKKLFCFPKITKNKVLKLLAIIGFGYPLLYTISQLSLMESFWISFLMTAFLVSFYAITCMIALNYENKIMDTIRIAFYYTIANFHKSGFPIFLFLLGIRILNGILFVYVVIVIAVTGSYFLYKVNYFGLEKLKFLNKNVSGGSE